MALLSALGYAICQSSNLPVAILPEEEERLLKIGRPEAVQMLIEAWDKMLESTVEGSWHLSDGGPDDPGSPFTIGSRPLE
jgi:hypothetical protein